MKIYDMHIHIYSRTKYMDKPDPAVLLANMEKAGVYGGCVFSNPPKEEHPYLGTDFEPRLEELFRWVEGYPDRLFPILVGLFLSGLIVWMHRGNLRRLVKGEERKTNLFSKGKKP